MCVATLARNCISSIDLSFFAHATEDQDKVLTAARNILPLAYAEQVSFEKSSLKGEYGNPIVFFKAQIRDVQIAEAFLKEARMNLSSLDKETLVQEMNLRLDKSSFYVRADKQAAFRGRFKLGRANPIRIRIKFKTSKVEEIQQICRDFGVLP